MIRLVLCGVVLASEPKGRLALAISESGNATYTVALRDELTRAGWQVTDANPAFVLRGFVTWTMGAPNPSLRLVDAVTGEVVLRVDGNLLEGLVSVRPTAQRLDEALTFYQAGGTSLAVSLSGLADYKEAVALKSRIEKLAGVQRVTEGDYADGRQLLELRYTKTVRELWNELKGLEPPLTMVFLSNGRIVTSVAVLKGARFTVAGTDPFAELLRAELRGQRAEIVDAAPWEVRIAPDVGLLRVSLVERATGIALSERQVRGSDWEADVCVHDFEQALVAERQRSVREGRRVRLVVSGLKPDEVEAVARKLSAEPLGPLDGGTQSFVWVTERTPQEIGARLKKGPLKRKVIINSTGERQLDVTLGR